MTTADAVDAFRYRGFLLCPTGFGSDGPAPRRESASNARAIASFLTERSWGVCDAGDIATMADEPAPEIRTRLRDWFLSASDDDVLVFAYSGRGVGSDGETRLATSTPGDHLAADEIGDWIGQSRAAAVYVIIDADGSHARNLFHDEPDVVVIASNDALVAMPAAPAMPSAFTATLLEALTRERRPTAESVFRALDDATRRHAGDHVDQPVVRIAPGRDLADAPLRRVAPRSTAIGSGTLGWAAVVALAIVGLVAFGIFASGSSDDAGRSDGDVSVAGSAEAALPVTTIPPGVDPTIAAPTTLAAAPESTAPSTTTSPATSTTSSLPPPPALSEADLGLAGDPIGDPACDGSWIAQIGATDAAPDGAAAIVSDALEVGGTSYTFTQGSCSSFNQSSSFYVVYLGPFASQDEARSACDAYVVSDPSTRQCFTLQLL